MSEVLASRVRAGSAVQLDASAGVLRRSFNWLVEVLAFWGSSRSSAEVRRIGSRLGEVLLPRPFRHFVAKRSPRFATAAVLAAPALQ